jgi:hypothetical protein
MATLVTSNGSAPNISSTECIFDSGMRGLLRAVRALVSASFPGEGAPALRKISLRTGRDQLLLRLR